MLFSRGKVVKDINIYVLCKKICLLCFGSIVLVGCSVKQDDTTATKAAKHLVNAPMYAVLAVGAAGTYAAGSVGYGISKGIDKLAGVELYLGETYLGKQTEEDLDNNTSLAKFYNNMNMSLYKDKDNSTYMFDKPTKDFIKDVKFGYKRNASSNKVRFPISKVKLEETGLDEDYLYSKMRKDKFGNPTFLGNSVVVRIHQERKGWAMSLYTTLYIIPNGAATAGFAFDETYPVSLDDQIDYFFPKK